MSAPAWSWTIPDLVCLDHVSTAPVNGPAIPSLSCYSFPFHDFTRTKCFFTETISVSIQHTHAHTCTHTYIHAHTRTHACTREVVLDLVRLGGSNELRVQRVLCRLISVFRVASPVKGVVGKALRKAGGSLAYAVILFCKLKKERKNRRKKIIVVTTLYFYTVMKI